MRVLIYLIFSLIIVSCINSGTGENTVGSKEDNDTLANGDKNIDDSGNISSDTSQVIDEYFNDPVVKSYSSESDTLVVSEDCVIFLWPDSTEVEELKIKYPDGYAEILDDMIYYASEAAMALDAVDIKNFFCDKSVLLFTGAKKDIFLKRKKAGGNMIFFKKGEKPFISDAIDFDIDVCTKFFAPAITDSIK
jgi:hypothetical protein